MSIVNPKFKFENFIEYKGNKMAKAALETIIENPLIFNPVFIYAETGMGKTHLVSALVQKLKGKGIPYLYIIPKELKDSMDKIKEFSKGFLIIDDFEEILKIDKETLEEFTQNFEFFVANEIEIILSSSVPYTGFKDLPEDFISRIKGGLVIEILKPDEEDRKIIIREKLKLKGINLEERYVNLLSKKDYKNIREIEGDLNRLLLRKITKGKIEDADIEEITGISLPVLYFSDILPEIEKSLEKLEIIAQEEDALRTALKEKVYIWEMKGFKTDRLKKLFKEKDIEVVKKEYKKFIEDVNKLIEFQKIYGEIKEQDPYIEEALFNPDKVKEVEEWIEKRRKEKVEEKLPEPEIELKEEFVEEIKEEIEEVLKEAPEPEEAKIHVFETEYNKDVLELIRKQAKEGSPSSLLIFSPGHRGLSTHLLYAYDINPSKDKIFYHSHDIADTLFSDENNVSELFKDYEFIVIDDAEIFLDVEDLSEKVIPCIMEEIEKGKKFVIGIRKNIDEINPASNFGKLVEISEKAVLKQPDSEIIEKILEDKLKVKNLQIEEEAKKLIAEKGYFDLKEFFNLFEEICEKADSVIKKEHLSWVKEEEVVAPPVQGTEKVERMEDKEEIIFDLEVIE